MQKAKIRVNTIFLTVSGQNLNYTQSRSKTGKFYINCYKWYFLKIIAHWRYENIFLLLLPTILCFLNFFFYKLELE